DYYCMIWHNNVALF
nr:immunoglobulin light chain junction region [Macaca mulatta]MOX19672.1 immunoglobulin light chain junction region [Macaca mulatta]MOX20293.1 immunoglobulin light chain junction region [Macaca mulatta]MOX20352.1 immunoglobulin light chain junction region [Macaca mulatta]MOX20969.1 immunoglobulin light chain junction region [Macaca mulatta]